LPRLAAAAADPDREILHVLDRLAFGPTEAEVDHVKAVGIEHYIAEQLAPERLAEPPSLTARLQSLSTLKLDPVQLFVEYGPVRAQGGVKPTPEERKERRIRARIIAQEARWARVWRATLSPAQLQEAMVDFWYNHFNVFALKGLDHLWVGAYEAAIRKRALGRFRDLLGAVAHHPAMLFYLDNVANSAPGARLPGDRESGINENYARELMELHTLGVDGGYTQDDVIALARILTGWGIARPNALPSDGNGFVFWSIRHDNEAKRFLGRDIAPNGEKEGEEALDTLARSPATAGHLATKLAQYFVADAPPPALVARLAARFQETDGDIRAVLQTLFASGEFQGSAGGKFKSPYRYVLSAVRAAGIAVNNPKPLLGAMARQGQPLYGCLTPDGYRDSEAAWLSPDAATLRVSFATALASGRLPLNAVPEAVDGSGIAPADAAALEQLLQPNLTARTRAVVKAAPRQLQAALLLGSPEFMRR
jgi:uncharacterized protein (DUF1800 family)